MSSFLLQLPPYQPVAPVNHLSDEAGVFSGGIEVPAAPQHEGLVQGVLQPVVGLLGHAVFVGFPGIDQCGAQTVVVQKFGIGIIESPAAAALLLVGEGRCVVGTDHLRHAAQFPESVLKSLLQGQEGLAGNHCRYSAISGVAGSSGGPSP